MKFSETDFYVTYHFIKILQAMNIKFNVVTTRSVDILGKFEPARYEDMSISYYIIGDDNG